MKIKETILNWSDRIKLPPAVLRRFPFLSNPLIRFLILYMILVPAFLMERASTVEVNSLRKKIVEARLLGEEYREIKERLDSSERKLSLQMGIGIVQSLDNIFSPLGMKDKVKSIKGVGTREIEDEIVEERADILLEKVSLNELVNLLHRIEAGPAMLSVKKIGMKKSFETPELLDVTITAALFSKK